uniref:Uncharacterized protein n=1 Tax=Fagus sylvatica TaxID=28930 RepID=A0A2N9I924_FAGSY
MFGRKQTWGFLPSGVFLGYPWRFGGKPIKATSFKKPFQNRRAFIAMEPIRHLYCLLRWDLVPKSSI